MFICSEGHWTIYRIQHHIFQLDSSALQEKKKKQKQNLKLSILSHFYAIALFLKCYDSECFQDLSLILKAVDGGG